MTEQQSEEKQMKNMEIYNEISLYLAEEDLLTPAERARFLELIEKEAYS